MSGQFDLDQVLADILNHVYQSLPCHHATIALLNEEGTGLYAYRSIGGGLPQGTPMISIDEGIIGWVARTGDLVIVPDVRLDDRYYSFDEAVRSELAAPMYVHGDLIGVFNVESDQANAYDEHHASMLAALAGQAALTIRLARLHTELLAGFDALSHSNAELSLRSSIGQLTADTLELDKSVPTIMRSLLQLVSAERSILVQLDPQSTQITHITIVDPAATTRIDSPEPDNMLVAELVSAGEPRAVTDLSGLDLVTDGAQTGCALPLTARGRPLGVIFLMRDGDPFTPRDLDRLQATANHLALALDNSLLLSDIQTRLTETGLLQTISLRISAALDIDGLLTNVTQLISSYLHTELVLVWQIDPLSDDLVLHEQSAVGLPAGLDIPVWNIDDEGILPGVCRVNTSFLTTSLAEEERLVWHEFMLDELGITDMIAVPIYARRRAQGVLLAANRVGAALDESHQTMLVTIGSQLGVAFANASLNASEHKRASLMQHINRIGAALSGILEREELYKRVVFSIQRLLGYEAVYLLEAADSHLEIVAQAIGDDMAELLSEPPTLPLKGSSPGRAARTLRSFLIRDIDLDPDAEPPADLPFTARSELIVPIRSGESIIGVLDVYSSERGAFDESDREALEALATQIAIALENTALHIETQRRLKEQQIVHQISGDLNAILDIPRLADATVYQMAHALDTTGCLFALYDAEKDVITVRSMYVSPTATRQEALNELPWRQALSELPASFRTMLLMGSPLLVNLDAAEGDDLAFMQAYEQQGLLLMPMVAGSRPLGLIMWADDRYPRHFDSGEVRLAQTLANHASVSLERARLHEATQRQLKRESLLRRLAETANNWVELDEMLDRFSREVCTALQATACTLYAFEEDHLTVRAQYSAPGALPAPAGSLKLEDYPALAVSLDRGKVLRVSFTTPGEDITGFEHLKEEGFTNVMVAPLVSRSRLLGAMRVLDDRASRWFSAADADLMEALATQVSIALDNANLFAELEERADELAVANQLKTEFLANISHELRTPMNSIIGFTDALVAGTYGELNDKQQDRIVKVRKNAGHLLTLINDLLDLSRIEAGRLSLEFESVDVPSVIDMICATIEPQIAAKGLDLIRDYAPDVPAASLDEQRFKQILINLLSNAIKFTEEGSITVRVQPAGEDVLQVNVIDTGIGISPEDKAIIFDEFRQVDGSSTRQYEGTGLGLAISRKLIEMMGGRIWVESALGEGSSFYLLIPTLKGESYE